MTTLQRDRTTRSGTHRATEQKGAMDSAGRHNTVERAVFLFLRVQVGQAGLVSRSSGANPPRRRRCRRPRAHRRSGGSGGGEESESPESILSEGSAGPQ